MMADEFNNGSQEQAPQLGFTKKKAANGSKGGDDDSDDPLGLGGEDEENDEVSKS